MHPKNIRIENFTYDLPEERIAKYPLGQRDSSKLLIYEDGKISEDTYSHIAHHIPQGSMLIFNQTKVVHARLLFSKPTGGAIEIFCLEPGDTLPDMQTAMLQKGAVLWKCLVGNAKKWKDGTVILLICKEGRFTMQAEMAAKHEGYYTIKMSWDKADLSFAEVLHHAGKVPLPPYINRPANENDDSTYQTIYARDEGSVAAPTAGLHFTPGIMESLRAKDIASNFVTLHVGAGTFKPVKSETMADHDMHAEWMEVSKTTLEAILHSPGKIVAVGTTSLRTLESLYWIGNKLYFGAAIDWAGIAVRQWDPYDATETCSLTESLAALLSHMASQNREKIITRTRILIAPDYLLRVADGLITNFHQPQSTLLLLVSALVGDDWKKVYAYAMEHDFRFLSYGDGSLVWPKRERIKN